MVNEVATDLRDKWLETPCWRALARHILSQDADECCKAPSLEDILDEVYGSPVPDCDEDYRLVEEGEKLEEGDQWLSGGAWRSLGDSHIIGMTVNASTSGSLPYGYYRRPLPDEGECFGWALQMMRDGFAVRSSAWDGKIQIRLCPEIDIMTPTILINDNGAIGTFFPDHKDLLATDWTLA